MLVSTVLMAPDEAVIDATPPGGPPLAGAGSLAAPSVPLEMLDALVVSVEQEVAALDKSPHAGCEAAGTPAVEMEFIHWCEACTRDSMPPSVDAVGVGRLAAGRVPVTPVASGMAGRSPASRAHGPNVVAEPHVPMTWCEVCPEAAPSVSVEPEMTHVSQLAAGLEQELAPGEGGGNTAPSWACPYWAKQPTRKAPSENHWIHRETCLGDVVICTDPRSLLPFTSKLLVETPSQVRRRARLASIAAPN